MKVAYSLKKKKICKYLCLCKENSKNDNLLQVFNLGFINIFSKGRNYFLTEKQNESFKTV